MNQPVSVWERVKLARHADRPLFLDYINTLFTEFDELHGDRAFADDRAILGGLARFDRTILAWQALRVIARSFALSRWQSGLVCLC